MIEDRNLTVHTYDERVAKAIFERIKSDYLPLFETIEKRVEELIKWNLGLKKSYLTGL